MSTHAMVPEFVLVILATQELSVINVLMHTIFLALIHV